MDFSYLCQYMKVKEVTAHEYSRTFPKPTVVYNSVEFSKVNVSRADEIRYVVVETDSGRPIAGMTLGRRGDRFFAPFSAPFACLDTNRPHRTSVIIETAAEICRAYPRLTLTLPPAPYATSLNTTTHLAFLAAGARQSYLDWNFHIDLTKPYETHLTAAAKSTLAQARRENFYIESTDAIRVYDIIKANHTYRNHPLRMSLQQVLDTTGPNGPVTADFFVLTNGEIDAAAAMIYHTAPDIAQVIYWGDLSGSICRNAMNLLAAELASHYRSSGFTTLDIGPASSDGVADQGLCDFKASIGCICSARPTLSIDMTPY